MLLHRIPPIPQENIIQRQHNRRQRHQKQIRDHRQHPHQFLFVLWFVQPVFRLLAGELHVRFDGIVQFKWRRRRQFLFHFRNAAIYSRSNVFTLYTFRFLYWYRRSQDQSWFFGLECVLFGAGLFWIWIDRKTREDSDGKRWKSNFLLKIYSTFFSSCFYFFEFQIFLILNLHDLTYLIFCFTYRQHYCPFFF